mgnify:CR=1 FL=1
MQALLVVDIDHYNNWKPDDIEEDGQKHQVAREIKRALKEKRAGNEIIVFIVLSHRDKITGQEIQLNRNPQSIVKNQSLMQRMLNRIKTNRPSDAESESWECFVCDKLPEDNRLAPFLEHRHQEPFEAVFIKTENDAFTNKELAPYLRSKGVDEVVLVGCSTFHCILETAKGALKAGFDVSLLSTCAYEPFSEKTKSQEDWLEYAQRGSGQSEFTAKII